MMKYFIKTILVSICCIIGITVDLYAQLPAGYIYYVYSDLNDCIEEARGFFNDSSATCYNNGAADYDDYWNYHCYNKNTNKKFYVVDSIDENNYRFNYSIVYKCEGCESVGGYGYGEVSMTELVEYLEPNIDYDDNQTFFVENLWELGDLEGTFREGVVDIVGDEEPYFCVPCLSSQSHEWSEWRQYNGNVYRREYWGVCSQFAGSSGEQFQYGCKGGTYCVSGCSSPGSTSMGCNACPTGANCQSANGHYEGIKSCRAGYRKNGNSCVMCDEDTYQSSNSFTGSSCTACPTADWGPTSDDDVYGRSDAGATSVSQCYMQNDTYTDNFGTFRIATDCYYTP